MVILTCQRKETADSASKLHSGSLVSERFVCVQDKNDERRRECDGRESSECETRAARPLTCHPSSTGVWTSRTASPADTDFSKGDDCLELRVGVW